MMRAVILIGICMRLFLNLSLILFSACSFSYDGWSTGEVTKIRVQSNKILITQKSASNPVPCDNASYIYLAQGDSAYQRNMFATLLTAYAAKREVSFAISGCSVQGYPNISEVWVK